jgi:hypothetical protein
MSIILDISVKHVYIIIHIYILYYYVDLLQLYEQCEAPRF